MAAKSIPGRGERKSRMPLIDDVEPTLPDRNKLKRDWSPEERALFCAQFYNTLFTAMTASVIRYFGHDKAYELHRRLLRHHQEHYFLDGIKKLGLELEVSDAIRCAKYHCISNAIGGLRTRYAVESPDKAWLVYFPDTVDNIWPGPARAIHTAGNMMADYEGWHSRNGQLLGTTA